MSQEKENQEKKRGFVFDKIDLIALLSSYSGDQQEIIMGKVEALEHQINEEIEIAQVNNPNFSEEDKKEIAINLLKQDGSDVSRSLLELVFNFVSDKNQEDQNKVKEKDEESVRTLEEKLGFVRYGIFLNLREKLRETKDETKLVFTQEEMDALEKMIWESKLVVLLRTKIEKDEFQGKTDEDMKKIIRETIDPITEKLVNDLKEEKRKKIEAKKILPKKKELTDEESLKKVREEIEKAMRFHLDEINGPKSEAFISGATADPVLDIGNFKFNPNIKSAVLELIEKANFRIREALDEKRMNLRESERINKEIASLFVEYKNAYFWEKLNKLRDYFSNQENSEAENAFEKIAELNEWIVDFQKAGMDGFRKYTKEDVDLLKKTLAELNEAVFSLENLKETSPEVNLIGNEIGEDNKNIQQRPEVVQDGIFSSSLLEEGVGDSRKKIEELESEVCNARKSYVLAEAEAHQKVSWFRRVLGKGVESLTPDQIDTVKEKLEVYRQALRELGNAKIEELKLSGNISSEVIKQFGMYLYNIQNADLGTEMKLARKIAKGGGEQVGKMEKMSEGVIGLVEKYRKMPSKYKIALGLTFFATGSTVALAGSPILAGAFLASDVIRRILGAAVSGMGAKEASRGLMDKLGERTMKKNLNKFSKNVEKGSNDPEVVADVLSGWLLDEVFEKSEYYLKRERKNKRRSLAIGIGVGTVVAGLAAFKYINELGFGGIKLEEAESVPKKIAGNDYLDPNTDDGTNSLDLRHHKVVFDNEKSVIYGGPDDPELNNVSEKLKDNLIIEKGGSITETLQDSGVKSDEAYRKVLDYAEKSGIDPKDLDLVYPGQEIELNPDGSIKNISDVNDAVGYPETVDNETVPSETDAVNQTSEVSVSKVEPLEIKKGDNLSKVLGQQGIGDSQIQSMLSDYAKSKGIEIGSLDRIYPGQQIVLSPDGKSIESILESHDSYMMKTIQSIGNNSEWRSVKNLSFDQIENPKINKNLSGIMEKYHDLLGDKANPKNGETMREWVARMAKLSMQNSRKEFFI